MRDRSVVRALRICAALLMGAAASPAWAQAPASGLDPAAFLAEQRCSDGALEVAEPGCPGAAAQTGVLPMKMRRHDWPGRNAGPDGYQVEDSFVADDGQSFVTTMGFAPFGAFDVSRGDGGEVYVVDGAGARIAATQDGGQRGVVQGFYGAGCGGTGWILFGRDAPTGRWAEVVARLKGRPIPNDCMANSSALTRYRLETTAIPFLIDGKPVTVTRPTIISEHYNAPTLDRARAMERFFMVQGVGRAIWEAWTREGFGGPPGDDLDVRCPGTAWSTPPGPGWRLVDCRYATNIRPADGFAGDDYNWPPDLTLP